MTAEELVKGLKAIDDPDVRRTVAAGDLSAAGNLDLSDEEAALLHGAADDYPDVAGFAFDAFVTLPASPGEPSPSEMKIPPLTKYGEALGYVAEFWKGQ